LAGTDKVILAVSYPDVGNSLVTVELSKAKVKWFQNTILHTSGHQSKQHADGYI